MDADKLLERLATLETQQRALKEELDRLRTARHDDRSEIARVAAAYELVSSQLQTLSGELKSLDAKWGDAYEKLNQRIGETQAAVISQAAGLHNVATDVRALKAQLTWRVAIVLGLIELGLMFLGKALSG